MLNDIRYSLRTLRQNPAFALTAILSIALAIGANSAIFTMADGLVLRPLPVQDPSSVVTIRSRTPSGTFSNLSYADYVDFRDRSKSFNGMVAYDYMPLGFEKNKETETQLKTGFLVSGNFFQALGITPALGRAFRGDEDQVPGRDAVAVLSYDFWRDEFGLDPSVVGRSVRLNGLDFTIIGVAPESFTGVDFFLRPALYAPIAIGPNLSTAGADLLTDRTRREFFVKALLKRDVSIESANAEMGSIAQSIEQSYPDTNRGIASIVMTELQARHDFDNGDQQLVGVLFALAIVVLSIACANVANLMLNRGRARAREVAIRAAIGANRRKIVRQLMTESLIISIIGGALGLLVTQYAIDVFSKVQIPGDLPIQFSFRMDYRVLAFTFAVAFVSAVLFGLAPAVQSSRADLLSALKAGQSDVRQGSNFGRNALVVVQIAGSLVLVLTAYQLYQGIQSMLSSDHGFRMDHRITMRMAPAQAGYAGARTEQFYRNLIEQARALPGVKSTALTDSLPMTTGFGAQSVIPEGYQFPVGQETVRVLTNYVSDQYFETFAIPILSGREFTQSDRENSSLVAVVNQEFAKRFFNGDAIGKRLRLDRDGPWIEIVGMAVTGHHITAFEPPLNFLYLPVSQHPQQRLALVAETFGDPADLAGSLRETVRSLDPNVPIVEVRTMQNLFEQRAVKVGNLVIGIVGALGTIGLLLALVGLYAVVSYQVGRRTREIGIRMAIGAARPQVLVMVLRQAGVLAIAGVGIGTILSFAGHGVLNAGIGAPIFPFDPFSVTAIIAALFGTTLLAAAIPARHASQIDPQRALRQE